MNISWTSLLFLVTVSRAASTGSQEIFATPDQAASVLLGALASGDYNAFLSVAGQQMAGFWDTGDPARDALDRDRFVYQARRNGIRVDVASGDRRILHAGRIEQPFPAPLVKTDRGWRFDDDTGSREFATRRMRRNERAVIELCRRFRDAQFVYFGINHEAVQFALRIRSTPGQHDGLFWSEAGEEDRSPLGPPFAAAAFAERRAGDETRPLFGYYFKILTARGPGEENGFALMAWPSKYGIDGTQTFVINHFGNIYQKDMGSDTARIGESMTVFNPDRTWSRFNGQD